MTRPAFSCSSPPSPKLGVDGMLIAAGDQGHAALHDGRLLTLDDTVRCFNVVLETRLTPEEESDVTAFMKAL